MPEYQIDHIHLMSPDPVKTAEFYEKAFGARSVNVMEMAEGRKNVTLDLSGITILISQAREDTVQNGLAHFGIRTDDLETAVKGLKADGVPFTTEITQVRPNFKISFLTAPENVSIELQQGSL
jgi:catechol 2,3-dioxygenase-like lactoylglutathione lyase family enzyme